MKVGELKKILADMDDNMEVGGSGHFGECLEVYSVHLSYSNHRDKFVEIEMESAGDEPD
jgi:hypothetical protein